MTKKKIRRAARPHVPPEMQPPEEKLENEPAQEPEAPTENVKEITPEEPETIAEEIPSIPPGFDFASAISMAQPLIDQAVAENLGKMNLPSLIQAAVKEQLQPIVNAAQERLSASPEQAGAIEPSAPMPSGNHSPLNDQVISLIIQKLIGGGGNSGGTDISKLAEMLKGVQTIAELANAPYRQGRNDALQETNATVKLLQGLGASDQDRLRLVAEATSRELRNGRT